MSIGRLSLIPEAVPDLTKLEELDLSVNYMERVTVPTRTSNLTNLKRLKLFHNHFLTTGK